AIRSFRKSFIELAYRRRMVVGPFAIGVSVMNNQTESFVRRLFTFCSGVAEHLIVAVGVSESSDRPSPQILLDANGLASLVVDQIDLGKLHQHRLATFEFVLELSTGADDLFRRNSISLFRPGTHELNAPARDDVRFEAIGTQMNQQLLHRLI